MIELGKIKRIDDLRAVWKHEALDFTPWLAQSENIKLLGEVIGIDIEVVETESNVDGFSADIVAVDINTGKPVIIENQLEETNHAHLGQIITYAAGKSASTLIWIVKKCREAHKAAINWLNKISDDGINFFIVEIELWQISGSLLAPKFNIIEQPNNWLKEVKKTSTNYESVRNQERLSFWLGFNNYVFSDEFYRKEFKSRKASCERFYDLSLGSSKCYIEILYLAQQNSIAVSLYIPESKELFYNLEKNKQNIEIAIGVPLKWQSFENKKTSRISCSKDFNLEDLSLRTNEYEFIKEMTLKFKRAFKVYINE